MKKRASRLSSYARAFDSTLRNESAHIRGKFLRRGSACPVESPARQGSSEYRKVSKNKISIVNPRTNSCTMYKTVRKGDASLQYTILPQTDQFNVTGFPPTSSKARPRVLKYTMALIMVVIILSCIATPFLINQNDHNLFGNAMLSMGRVEHSIYTNTTKTYVEEITVKKGEEDGEHENFQIPIERGTEVETTSRDPDEFDENLSVRTSATSSSTITTTTTTTTRDETSTEFYTTLRSPSTKSSTGAPKKLPRVTLKLKENETIPQMYMKAGIASYKKGNITTSVLARGLSLEGLIFKTPEGTIKPWPQNRSFMDAASYFQWKGMSQIPTMMYIVLAGLALLATLSIILMVYIQRKASRRHRGNAEVSEIESQEEDESTLLAPETRETAERE